MKRKTLSTLFALVLFLVLLVSIVPAASASTTSDYCVEPAEQEFLTLINNYRASKGLGSLSMSWTLAAAAQHHSLDIGYSIQNGTWDTVDLHTLSDGTTWYQNIVNHGYMYSGRGENIAWGYPTAQRVFDAWRNSPTHDENMRWSTFKVIGIDLSLTSGRYTNYPTWTTTFGSTVDGPPPVCGSATTPTSSVATPTTSAPTPTRTPTLTPTPSGPVDNTPPTTSITSPLNGATVARRSKVTITAAASDNIGVARVEFFIDGKRKCSDSSLPYNCLWSVGNRPGGTYELYTVAYDTSGNSARSATVAVTSSR